MDLKTFISTTLVQIVEGVAAATATIAEGTSNASVNPVDVGHDSQKTWGEPHPVEFDVAVTTTDDTQVGGSLGIKVAGIFSLGGDVHDKSTSASVSRIKFVVQLAQPSSIERGKPPAPLPRPPLLI